MRPKRLISLLVAVCMMITMLPLSAVTAFAADTSSSTGTASDGRYKYDYEVDANGNATITKFLGPVGSANPDFYDITIPEELNQHPVTGLGANSFAVDSFDGYEGNPLCSKIQSVTILQNVKSIGYRAFHDCDGLESLTFHGESIGGSAFTGCSDLTSVTIPENVTAIYSDTFKKCSKLEYIILPAGLTSFGDRLSGCPDKCVIYSNKDKEAVHKLFGDKLAGHKLLGLCHVTFDAKGGKLTGNLTNYLTDNLTDHAEVPVYETEKNH